jgi:WD40 repeat protein
VDQHGDPLPAGAVGRLGTVQLRAGRSDLSFSADSRTLTGIDNARVNRWAADTGGLPATQPLPTDGSTVVRLSEDGRTAVLASPVSVWLCDLPSAKRIDLRVPQKFTHIEAAAVSNDRRHVLVADSVAPKFAAPRGALAETELSERLVLWDTTTATARTLAADEAGIVWLGFSADGKRAVTSGRVATRVWDTSTGKKVWEVRGYNAEECHFTPDSRSVIAAPGGGQREWHVWDADTGKPAAGLRPPTVGYAWSFAISPDGAQLLIPTDTDYVLWDLKAGEVRHRWPGANQSGRGTFAADGKSVVTADTILRRWDLATGKNVYADVSAIGHTAPVRRVFFTPDGTRLVSVGDDRTARVWDVATTRSLRTIRIESPVEVWAMTPDGSTLVGVDSRLTVHRWPVAGDGPKTSVDLREAQRLNIGLQPREAHVLPDGTLALLAWPRSPEYQFHRFSFSFWDLETGRLVRWGGDPGEDYRGDYVRLAPDGRTVASPDATFDTRTGARRGLAGSPFGLGGTPLFSPDGRLVAAASRDTRVWELASGRVLADLPHTASDPVAFSSDGRRLVCSPPGSLVVWDLGTRKVAEWSLTEPHAPARASQLTATAFSPDGRTIATGLAGGTVLLWRVPAPVPDGRWSEADAAAAWDALIDDNPGNAYPAAWQLSDYPAEAVRFLRDKFSLVPAAGPDEWAKLIDALDSPRFAEREAASKRVRELGRAAEGPLRQALKHGPSPEQVARIEALLASIEPPARVRGEDLRAVRAVAVVETCATPEARRLLTDWSERGSPPRLADEAARALGRLKHRRP